MGCLWVFRVYWKSHNQQNSSGFQLELFSPTKPSAFWKASECNRDVKTFHHRQAPRNGTAFTLVCCGTWRSSIWILFAWISFAFLLFFVSFHLKNTSTIGLYLTWKWKTMYKEKRRDFVVKTWILSLTTCATSSKSLPSGSAVEHNQWSNKSMCVKHAAHSWPVQADD